MKGYLRTAAVACAAWLAMGCAAEDLDIHAVGQLDYDGRVLRIETLGRYSSTDAVLLFSLSGAKSRATADHDYFLYRVTYPTLGLNGESTRVSGLIAVPATRRIKGNADRLTRKRSE